MQYNKQRNQYDNTSSCYARLMKQLSDVWQVKQLIITIEGSEKKNF